MPESTEPKVILMTGASSGIGEAATRLLASQGHHIVIGARRVERLAALANEIQASGGSVLYRAVDVTSLEDVNALAESAIDAFGRLTSSSTTQVSCRCRRWPRSKWMSGTA